MCLLHNTGRMDECFLLIIKYFNRSSGLHEMNTYYSGMGAVGQEKGNRYNNIMSIGHRFPSV